MPVMVVSARGSEAEKVRALWAGADDYVVKPFGLLEVLARVDVLLRRPAPGRALADRSAIAWARSRSTSPPGAACVPGTVALRPKEFDLLVALCRARGAVVSRGDLLNWGLG